MPTERSRRPVFVMGCHRSGTNLLYDTLLSAGGFAVYRGYLPVYKILIPRFGSLNKLENRRKIAEIWLRSKGHRRSGLPDEWITSRIVNHCRTGGDFIRATMDEIARRQNVARWAVYDPDNVLHVRRVKADIPDALFVHIIRDGRDIALSLKKMGGFTPLPWDRAPGSLQATALYWAWMARQGRAHGRLIPGDYIELRYEDLVSEPRATLRTLGQFLEHDLDYDRITQAGLGSLSESNSSFREDESEAAGPVQRWKDRLPPEDIASLERLIGPALEEFGYTLTTPAPSRKPGLSEWCSRVAYPAFLGAKFWLRLHTPAGRFASMSALELAEPVGSQG